MKKTKRILGVVGLALTMLSLVSCKLTKSIVGDDKPEADMSKVVFEDQYFQYDGEEKRMTISGQLPDGVGVEYENNVQKEKGTYEVTATFSTAGLYKKIKPMTAKMHIVDLNVGSYPQSVVKDKTLHDNIVKYGTFNKTTGRTTYQGKEYEILKYFDDDAEKSEVKFNDGSIMEYGKTYVFEFEPIKWQILDKTEDGYVLLSEDILDLCNYFYEVSYYKGSFEYSRYGYEYTSDKYDDFYSYTLNGDGTRSYYLNRHALEDYAQEQRKLKDQNMVGKKSRYYPNTLEHVTNNYEYSYVREWLNVDFYNTAFNSSDKEKVLKTTVDNSVKSAFEYYPETFYDANGEWRYYDCYSDNMPVINFWETYEEDWNGFMSNDTLDYVYLPSANDLTNTHYGFNGVAKAKDDTLTKDKIEATTVQNVDGSRKCGVSDYAACRGAKQFSLLGWWEWDYMTRTPEHVSRDQIYTVSGKNGQMFTTQYLDELGVRPMITVKIDD